MALLLCGGSSRNVKVAATGNKCALAGVYFTSAMPEIRLPFRYKLLIRLASWFAPSGVRRPWRARREREAAEWWAFLVETDRLSPRTEAEILRTCWSLFRDAVGYRFQEGIATTLRRGAGSAAFCLGGLAALALIAMVATGGLPATRAALRALPYDHPERVLTLGRNGHWPNEVAGVTPEDIAAWKQNSRAIEDIAPYYWPHGEREIREGWAGANFFEVLGVRPYLGRLFHGGDRAGAVLTHETWRERFNGDRSLIGRGANINGRAVEVLGVLPPGFWFISHGIEVWTVLEPTVAPWRTAAVGRLKPGAQPVTALGEVRTIARLRYPNQGHRQLAYVSMLAERVPAVLTPFKWGLGLALFAAACASALACAKVFRYGLFLFVKSALLLFAMAAVCCEWSVANSLSMLGWSGQNMQVLPVVVYWLSAPVALLWLFADQRRRCRVCLARLATPTHFGSPSSWLLDPMGTELLCERGHGTLYVPETHASTQKLEGWTKLDESWREIFTGAGGQGPGAGE